MKKDTIISSNRTDNLTEQQCKEWWDRKVTKEKYFTAYSFGLSQPQLYAKVLLNKQSKILELGCGYGRQIYSFCQVSDYVYGIDVAEGAKELTLKHCPKAIIKIYDGITIPFEDNYFDFLTAVFVFQHVSKKNAVNLLKESIRVLKIGGRFLFEFLGGNYIGGKENDHYSGGLNGMYNNGYTKGELEKIGNELNLKTVNLTEIDMSQCEAGTTNIWWEVIK